jgi:hypothetical protein
VDLLAEPHNALDFWFLEIAIASQRTAHIWKQFRNPLLTVLVTKIKDVSLQCE